MGAVTALMYGSKNEVRRRKKRRGGRREGEREKEIIRGTTSTLYSPLPPLIHTLYTFLCLIYIRPLKFLV